MMRRRGGRRAEPRIVDPATHPRKRVGLRVAALFLDVDERTMRARIETGEIPAWRDGRVYRIEVSDLVRYRARRVGWGICSCGVDSKPQINVVPNQPVYCSRCGCRVMMVPRATALKT
jgi:excisionase family DNA binding protein